METTNVQSGSKPTLAVIVTLLLIAGLSGGASAAPLLLNEDFDYLSGVNLVGQGGWVQTGTVVTSPLTVMVPGLSFAGYPSSGIGGMVNTFATSGQDANSQFTATTVDTYAACLVSMTATQAAGDYFFHFLGSPVAGNFFMARVFAKKDPASTNYAFGLQFQTAASSLVYTGYNYTLGTTYLLVVKYTIVPGTANDTVHLWIDPILGDPEQAPLLSTSDATMTDVVSLVAVGLRQGTAANAPQPQVDGIRVGTTWEDVLIGPPATGACCDFATSACTITTEAACGFAWLGADTICSTETCPLPSPTGACCDTASGECTITSEAACGFAWLGADTECNPTACPAPLLLNEDFDYTDGVNLVGQGGWVQTGTITTNPLVVAVPGLSYEGYLSSGIGGMVNTFATSGQDANHEFVATTVDTYAAFLVNMTATQQAGDYFFHFFGSPIASNKFMARVFAKQSPSSTDYAFGLQFQTAATSLVYTDFDFALGTTHLVVVKYTIVPGPANDMAQLWVDPIIGDSEPEPLLSTSDAEMTDVVSLMAVGLRQGTATDAPEPQVDGIRVGTSWDDVVNGGPPAVGACCFAAACEIYSSEECAEHGGTYEGTGTLCVPDPCPTSAVGGESQNPSALSLHAVPNPSTGSVLMQYQLRVAGTVTLEIFSPGGSLLRRIIEGDRGAGLHSVPWDALDDSGHSVPSGVYLARVTTSEGTRTARVVLAR